VANETQTIDESKPLGLILTLKGAPETPHTVVGVRGQYLTVRATAIGGDGELSLQEAKDAIANGAPFELVNIAAKDVDSLRAQAADDLIAARTGAIAARKEDPTPAEAQVITDHVEAVKEQ
jgi:hypothetical protein